MSNGTTSIEEEEQLLRQQQAQQTLATSPSVAQFYQRPYADRADSSLIIYQLNAREILDELEHKLKGERKVWNKNNSDFEYQNPSDEPPIVNKEGINKIMLVVESVVNKSTIMSNYDPDQVNETVVEVVQTVLDLIFMCHVKFEISKDNFGLVRSFVENAVKATLYRAKGGQTMKLIMGAERIHEIHTQAPQQRGILRSLGKVFR